MSLTALKSHHPITPQLSSQRSACLTSNAKPMAFSRTMLAVILTAALSWRLRRLSDFRCVCSNRIEIVRLALAGSCRRTLARGTERTTANAYFSEKHGGWRHHGETSRPFDTWYIYDFTLSAAFGRLQHCLHLHNLSSCTTAAPWLMPPCSCSHAAHCRRPLFNLHPNEPLNTWSMFDHLVLYDRTSTALRRRADT